MAAPAVDRAAWSSPWRTRSVGDKALLCLGLLSVALAAPHWPGALAVLAVTLVAALVWARVPAPLYARAMAAPLVFIAIGVASIAVSVGRPGPDALWSAWLFSVTPATLASAMHVAARALAGTAAVLLLACTTPMVDLLEALRRARIPDPLVEVASLTYRLLFVLADVADTVRASQAGRLGYDGFACSWHSTGLLASAVLVRSWDRARRMEDGLAGRGFDGALRTLAVPHPRSALFEATAVAIVVALAAVACVPAVAP
ncbi:cobalt ECF transporter T component CbiQ [Mariniluteicoccus endophyticus]